MLKKRFAGVIGLLFLILLIIIAIPVKPTIPKIEPRTNTQYWTMSSGYRIAYTYIPTQNEKPKAPIVVLHGGPGGYIHSAYIETFGQLTELGHDVYLYDQVGSGLSDRLSKPKDYTFLGHANDLQEIITQQIGVEKVILIGQSYGGMLASYVVAHHANLIEKAILTSPGGIQPALFDEDGRWVTGQQYPIPQTLTFVSPPDASREMKISSWPIRSLATIGLATVANIKLMPDTEADGVLNTVATEITKGMVCDPASILEEEGGGGFYAHGWSNWFGDVEDWRTQLKMVDTPVLVLQGQCDYIPYASAYEYADLLPQGSYQFVEGAGHVIWWEQPDLLLAYITDFLTHD